MKLGKLIWADIGIGVVLHGDILEFVDVEVDGGGR